VSNSNPPLIKKSPKNKITARPKDACIVFVNDVSKFPIILDKYTLLNTDY